MKLSTRTLYGTLQGWIRRFESQAVEHDDGESPLRSELFSADQMQQHGKVLADEHRVQSRRPGDRLLVRLAENERFLLEVRNLLAEDVTAERGITPAGEWLLDNFYLIEEEIRTVRRHLPKGYSRELPHLSDGPSAGLPRVYDIALETISHGDGRVDPEILSSLVMAYQSVTILKLGELWAIPIMLRLALIGNLYRVAVRIAVDRVNRNRAVHWADQMTKIAEDDPTSLILSVADMARSNPSLVSSFVAEFVRRLQGRGPALALPLTWIEHRLSESDLTIEQSVCAENQQQAADQVSMSNSIDSLRFLDARDWRTFVETMSVVEQVLGEDPAGIYSAMDFATRDRYRHVVEKVARKSQRSESEVARTAIQLAQKRKHTDCGERARHVGFFLISKGRAELERLVEARISPGALLGSICRKAPLFLYGGSVVLLAAALATGLTAKAYADGLHGWALGFFAALVFLCASHLTVSLANWLVTLLITPQSLPRMDFSKGIPPEMRTLVVIPTMLTAPPGIEELIKALEVRFLANSDDHLHFGLLTDLRDANEESLPQDETLLHLARQGIEALNEKYPRPDGTAFFLFHRPRRWNPQERIWMGYERKRGKLTELNGFLRGKAGGCFALVVGETALLQGVNYVITLDTDTQLPRDAARLLVSAMAHPLNRACYDEERQRVVDGYGILQPRVSPSLPGTNRSHYAHMCASEIGIDPYTNTVSDIYQDLFGEGSFIGKGIYEVDAFQRSLDGRFHDNQILSHDLLEGCYARSGLLSDVLLYEDYPARYDEDVSRRHRWIRGDWQIARWLLPVIFCPDGHLHKNPLSLLSRWKIFDNLRRSLMAAALTLLLLAGWTVLSQAWFWTLTVVGVVLIPSLAAIGLEALRTPAENTQKHHFFTVVRAFPRYLGQATFSITCLPYEAFFSLDAVGRTLWRMLILHKGLLQWNPSGDAHNNGRTSLVASYAAMWVSPLLAVVTATALAVFRPFVLPVAGPVLGLWLFSPAVVWWLGCPRVGRREELTAEQTVFLRRLSRKTWAFFETFVGPEDNWLPPDNYQEKPQAMLAHRTSPTNMGLALLANLAACDFGAVSAGRLIDRTAKALQTMQTMERYQGHFFNWYDTQTLEPLPPRYVSSVDSGNLAGHLLTLRAGLLELVDRKILETRLLDSLNDVLGIVLDTAAQVPAKALPSLAPLRESLEAALRFRPDTLSGWRKCLERLLASADQALVQGDADREASPESQLKGWLHTFSAQCRDALDEMTLLAPWVRLLPSQNDLGDMPCLEAIPTLRDLVALETTLLPQLAQRLDSAPASESDAPWRELHELVATAVRNAQERFATVENLILQCGELAHMEYGFLYDEARHLLAIGYNVDERRRDASYYDLLASEARLSSFVAIAQGQLPQESWFALGRLLTSVGGETILLSWSGSMFEYLMPLLVMPSYEHSLLDQTCKAAVARQIEYGKTHGVPWGISESGYNAINVQRHYQYRAFGVPGLGLKRGLAEDLVIAPYAAMLALMVAPGQACRNLKQLSTLGLETQYGFYEAIDYTPERLPHGQSSAVVRSFMTHHQGMGFLSLAHLLLDRPMQRRFESAPLFQATLLLLQERIPKASVPLAHTTGSEYRSASPRETPVRIFNSPDTPTPEVQLLSNGRYHVMVTNAGGGYSRWKDFAVTRWREDTTCDDWGTFCYIRDVASGDFWSTAFQPTRKQTKRFEAIFSEGRVEFHCRDHEYDVHTEIAVSPEDDIELRRVRITNRARIRRTLEITSYAEVVLTTPVADALHPAFSSLFVQTEIIRQQQAILCSRRPRAEDEHPFWMLHMMVVHGVQTDDVSYETDRLRFIGRGNTLANPQAMAGQGNQFSEQLSDSEGSVLDPVVAIRCRLTLEPGESATVDMVFGVAVTRVAAVELVNKYQDWHLAQRVFELAWSHNQVLLHHLNASESDAQIYSRLAGSILYANPALRASQDVLVRNRRGQSGLWGQAVSGDLPIVLLQIEELENIALVRQMAQAHAYWRLKGLAVDLVIWNEDQAGYRQLLHDQIQGLISAGIEVNVVERPGGIFVRSADRIAEEDRILFQTVARVIISDKRGTLADQISGRMVKNVTVPLLSPTQPRRREAQTASPLPQRDLSFFNGLGGFTPDGREYVITTSGRGMTPTPWVNVLANPQFGSVVSESGLGCTWSENAHEFRLTPWENDPVSDSRGEAFYLRDEDGGYFWSPTPLPCGGTAPYVTRHGFGYSVFEHTEHGIASELWVYVSLDAAVKFAVLKVRNSSGHFRKLSATGYVEWVLGDLHAKSAMHVITAIDPGSGALFAHNPYNTEFPGRTAFFDVDETSRTVTGDRTEFLGRNGTLHTPAAMTRSRLSGRVGAGLDPCAAIQVRFDLSSGQEREIIFRLGVGQNLEEARTLITRFRGADAAHGAREVMWQHWTHTLGAIHVETPDHSLNVLTNGWLLYQTLACRLWARNATYQSGGAFGFRDQLQDVMALVHARPHIVREHLLLCAAHQFEQGDVQHWWHPPTNRGVRTRCSDDYLWLPLATCRYVHTTGDTGVLDEPVCFLQGRPLKTEEDSYYDLPTPSDEVASLYEHCVRAIENGLTSGVHGLPLMGSGDWNDGMDRVGAQGRGESVWLGFFLHEVLTRFAELAKMRGEASFAERCLAKAVELRRNIEEHGWDGAWYLRAYFDDGSPLGSSQNVECRIDSIVQSWAVLSDAGKRERVHLAMNAVDAHLVRREQKLVQLLEPPFDTSTPNPGYIKGYAPGVRENGGQYTQAGIWMAMAFAHLGDAQRAWELFGILNPVNHARSTEETAVYMVEPYVMAADVYAVPPHVGRGGWTWYTGSAGWMYRLIVESLLGLELEANRLRFKPCLPADWESFTIHYRYQETVYHISVLQTAAGEEHLVSLDGVVQSDRSIPLVDDHREHWAEVKTPAANG